MILNISEAITACNKLKKIDLDIGDKYLEKILKSKKEEQYKSCDDKTLVEPVKEEIKQQLKQAVHCKTQEEWDFVTKKLGNNGKNWFIDPNWGNNKSFCISFEDKNQSQTLDFYQNAGYQILSFQEWCDLNGYKNALSYLKIESNKEFKLGQWCMWGVGDKVDVFQIKIIHNFGNIIHGDNGNYYDVNKIRHATPEEINNHLISIGQIPAGKPLNTGIEPNKDGVFHCVSVNRGGNPLCEFTSISINGEEIYNKNKFNILKTTKTIKF